ncbi:alpha/beta fold hydrolase [Rhodovarius crocodyli]|uniref:alpha/beta fold hydrolase n=1 Tax=Rhodovarius crocodyli TaxID=1979269 RepID=UPI0013E38B9F|nr:alpha/beta fold hydrolase [Rhodovarius crocodyli]
MTAFLTWGSGAPLICLHGIGGAADLWAPTAAALPGRQVLAWNQPGYGGNPLLADLSFSTLADNLAAELVQKGITSADFIGHSMGGMVAIELALRHPGLVRTLIPYATTPAFGGKDPSFARDFLAKRLAPLDAGASMAECAAGLVRGMCAPTADPAAEPAAIAAMSLVPEATYRATLACLTTFDRRDALGAITQPTHCIAGAEDKVAPARTMQRMADAIPGATLSLIPGAGHLPHLEQPAAFHATLRSLLDR